MEQLSATDSGLLFYCDLENILDGLKDFSRPRNAADQENDGSSSDDGSGPETSSGCYVTLEEAKSSNRMALAALKAKNKVVEELSLEAVILREELMKERTLRRAAEAADEDQSFLREQMETILKEKARLAQDNARLKREAQTMARELEILGVQVERASHLPKRAKEVERKYKKEKELKEEAEETVKELRKECALKRQEIQRLQHKMDDERENWKRQERALLTYASKKKMFQTEEDDLSLIDSNLSSKIKGNANKNESAKQGLALVTQARILGGGSKSKRVIVAELEDMSSAM